MFDRAAVVPPPYACQIGLPKHAPATGRIHFPAGSSSPGTAPRVPAQQPASRRAGRKEPPSLTITNRPSAERHREWHGIGIGIGKAATQRSVPDRSLVPSPSPKRGLVVFFSPSACLLLVPLDLPLPCFISRFLAAAATRLTLVKFTGAAGSKPHLSPHSNGESHLNTVQLKLSFTFFFS